MSKDNVIPFPTVREGQKLREEMGELEEGIKDKLDMLQSINEDIIGLTVAYEEMLYRLCEITGVKLPNDLDWSGEPEEE
jgi:hypothetical protein|tara:strand:+ start:1409 stop:1645 length:237 start_codon:yes stop_codon:yes gene_type:complete